MPKITKIEPVMPLVKPQLKVAAYARVSKETDRLMHVSFISLIKKFCHCILIQKSAYDLIAISINKHLLNPDNMRMSVFQRRF